MTCGTLALGWLLLDHSVAALGGVIAYQRCTACRLWRFRVYGLTTRRCDMQQVALSYVTFASGRLYRSRVACLLGGRDRVAAVS
jgi:hypothetical protein